MWTNNPDERLRQWKAFRVEIGTLSLDEACKRTAHLWSYAPYVTRYLESDRKHSLTPWPDPWDLLYENYYCDLSKALGMTYTLYLSNHKPEDIELSIYKNPENGDIFNIVQMCQGKYVLNYEFDTVVNKKQLASALELKYSYTASELELDIY